MNMLSNIPSVKLENSHGTEKEFRTINFTWTIDDFSSYFCDKTGQGLVNSTFGSELNDQVRCSLEIYPNGYSKESEEYISIYLNLEKSDKLPMLVTCEFCILTVNGTKQFIQKISKVHNFLMTSKLGIDKFINTNEMYEKYNENLPDDRLTISCEISLTYYSSTIASHPTTTNVEDRSTSLVKDVGKLFESSNLSDCIIKVRGVDINVHKIILACRSEVFLSIFHNKDENFESNIIEINDFTPEAVKEMVTYIYTEKSPNLNKIAGELLSIATKYNLMGLKRMAEDSLCNNLNVENACDYLEMSDVYTAKLLKKSCISFICKNAENVVKNENWTNFVVKYPLLLDEIFKSLIEVYKPSTN